MILAFEAGRVSVQRKRVTGRCTLHGSRSGGKAGPGRRAAVYGVPISDTPHQRVVLYCNVQTLYKLWKISEKLP